MRSPSHFSEWNQVCQETFLYGFAVQAVAPLELTSLVVCPRIDT